MSIEEGVPLPELPELDSPNRPKLQMSYRGAALIWGIILLSAGVDGMGAFVLSRKPELHEYWSMPLPLALAGGLGLLLYHLRASRRTEQTRIVQTDSFDPRAYGLYILPSNGRTSRAIDDSTEEFVEAMRPTGT